MADSFTANLNLRKPEVGAATDTWGGTSGLNSDLDLLDALFNPNGTGTPVGVHVGVGKILLVEGGGQLQTQSFRFSDQTDPTKQMIFAADQLPTATPVTVEAPPASGTMATQQYVQAQIPPGTIWHGYYGTPPAGWVFADGRTIGNASSGGTNRANADCVNLFTQLWNLGSFAVLPSRGTTAAADWTANKTIQLPDHSSRVAMGRDNLSGTQRAILDGTVPRNTYGGVFGAQYFTTTISVGVSGGISGGTSGSLTVSGAITTTSLNLNSGSGVQAAQGGDAIAGSTSGSLTVGGSFSGSGSGSDTTALPQPTIVCDVIIKL